jgi:hypothetical protein
LMVTEENGQAIIDLVDEYYNPADYQESMGARVLN